MGVPKYQEHPPFFNNNYVGHGGAIGGSIAGFYKDATVFVTGGTGFLGKALLEKLLRTCDVRAIYVLVRAKRGLSVEQRLQELLKNPVFNRVREKEPQVFGRLRAVAGDVALPNLGLSEADRRRLIEEVQIVFHSAATVKFNENLKNAVVLNTLGTKRVLDLCHSMELLKSFIHVSTAYSNSPRASIEEIVYEPPYDPHAVISCVELLPDEGMEWLSSKILGNHPNTYTLTKAMAEHLVLESSSSIPAAVVRPSIITAAWKEPYPGWVDNVGGITGIFMECGRGTITSIVCDDKCTMDLIPVDIVVNTLVTAAWHTVANPSNTMRVYNCTSGPVNPITWRQFGQLTHKYWREFPSKYVTWYPGFTYRTSTFLHMIYAFLFHLVPSALLDVVLYLTRQKPMMLKISRKFYSALEAGKFFSTNQWSFSSETMSGLASVVKEAPDGAHFSVDMAPSDGFTWNYYVKDFALGVRKYVLKDEPDSLAAARTKLNRLYWFQKAFQALTVYALFRVVTH